MYSSEVKRYSISEARKQLPAIVEDAEAGQDAVLTRRGLDVAVLVSPSRYEHMRAGKRNFGEAYAEFREKYPEGADTDDDDGPELTPEWWDSLRDRSPGREVIL